MSKGRTHTVGWLSQEGQRQALTQEQVCVCVCVCVCGWVGGWDLGVCVWAREKRNWIVRTVYS